MIKARLFADYWHTFESKSGVPQLYNDQPYVTHCDDIVEFLKLFGLDEDQRFVDIAYLHDTLEDTNLTYHELEKHFGLYVAEHVWAVTGVGSNRKERNQSIYRKIASCTDAATIKIADRWANTKSPKLIEMYRKELHDFDVHVGSFVSQEMWDKLMENFQ